MEKGHTGRGFGRYEFKDRYGSDCSLQMSSLATEEAIWLGVDDAKPQIMMSDAIRMGLIDSSIDDARGWIPFDIPPQVLLSTRMHLTRKLVAEMLPILQKFAETGDI